MDICEPPLGLAGPNLVNIKKDECPIPSCNQPPRVGATDRRR